MKQFFSYLHHFRWWCCNSCRESGVSWEVPWVLWNFIKIHPAFDFYFPPIDGTAIVHVTEFTWTFVMSLQTKLLERNLFRDYEVYLRSQFIWDQVKIIRAKIWSRKLMCSRTDGNLTRYGWLGLSLNLERFTSCRNSDEDLMGKSSWSERHEKGPVGIRNVWNSLCQVLKSLT